jgi:hypothetical protein
MNKLWLFLLPSLLYYLIISSVDFVYTQRCDAIHAGFGKCVLLFQLHIITTNSSILHWETVYEGNWLNSKKHGYGFYQSFSGNKYSGNWASGRRAGVGSFTLVDGTTYDGMWISDEFEGRENKIKFPDTYKRGTEESILQNAIWIGETNNQSQINGTGKLSLSVGDLEGTFLNGYFQTGTVTCAGKKFDVTSPAGSNWSVWGYTSNFTVSQGNTFVSRWNGNILNPDTNSSLHDVFVSLKWFEYHVLVSREQIRSEIFHFEPQL